MEVLKGNSTLDTILNKIKTTDHPSTLICFSHLRWDFVYQRPQHLLSRFANHYSTFFVEEPYYDAEGESTLTFSPRGENIWIVTPHIPANTSEVEAINIQKNLLNSLLKQKDLLLVLESQ